MPLELDVPIGIGRESHVKTVNAIFVVSVGVLIKRTELC